MSPEQIAGEPVDTRSDILGWAQCTLKSSRADALYIGSDVSEISRNIISLPAPIHLRSTEEQECSRLIRRCLARTPEDRPSAAELCTSLETGAAAAAALGRYVLGIQEVSARRNEDSTAVQAEPRTITPRISPLPAPVPSPAPRSSSTPISDVGVAAPMPVPATAVGVAGPRIEFVAGGRVISIVDTEARIRRNTHNDVVVDDKAVSRYACVILRGDTMIVATNEHTYYLKELNTANGILVNGQRVSTVASFTTTIF